MWGQSALTEQEIAVPVIREGTTSIAKYTRGYSMKASPGCLARLSAVLSIGRTRSKIIKATFILAAVLAAFPAMAQTITFTISDQGSGSLNGVDFSSQTITFTQVTDTTLITNSCGYPCAPNVTMNTVYIPSVGTETLTGTSYFFANGINLIGITSAPGSAFLAEEDNSLSSYTMTTSFGPTSYPIYDGSAVSSVSTSSGALDITWTGADATFTAVVGAPTPEPGTLTLLGSGLLALAYVFRRKRFAQS